METWQYNTAADIDQTLADRLRQIPREPDMLVWSTRMIMATAIRVWLKAYHRFRVVGRENLPKRGAYVLVANHTSHLDTLCLLSGMPIRRLHYVFPAAAKDYFFVSLPRLALGAVLVNALPFDRQTHIRQSLAICRRLMDQGNNLILFPEGTRSPSGQLNAFKPGIGLLLAGSDCPAVPCFLRGTYQALPKGQWIPRPRRIELIVGQPRTYSQLSPGKASAIQIASELQEAVRELSLSKGRPATG